MAALVKPELVKHREANGGGGWWGWTPNYEQDINNEINNARNWLSKRTGNFYNHVAARYGQGTPTPLTINKGMNADVTVVVNGVTLTTSEFDGKFFANRQLTVEASAEGQEVKGWKVIKTNVNGTTEEQEINNPTYSVTMPLCKSLALQVLTGSSAGINIVGAEQPNTDDGWFTLEGFKLNSQPVQKGIYIRNGKKVVIK
jgi:hypothetical protein